MSKGERELLNSRSPRDCTPTTSVFDSSRHDLLTPGCYVLAFFIFFLSCSGFVRSADWTATTDAHASALEATSHLEEAKDTIATPIFPPRSPYLGPSYHLLRQQYGDSYSHEGIAYSVGGITYSFFEKIPLVAAIHLPLEFSTPLPSEGLTVTLTWRLLDRTSLASDGGVTWAESEPVLVSCIDGTSRACGAYVTVRYLRPYSEYELRVWLSIPGYEKRSSTLITSGTMKTLSSGFEPFDEGPFFSIVQGNLTRAITTSGMYARSGEIFRGIMTFDQEGYIIWALNTGEYTYVFDTMENGDIVTMNQAGNSDAYPGSLIRYSSISGEVLLNYTHEECTDPSNWGLISHDSRVDPLTPDHVLTIRRYTRKFDNVTGISIKYFEGAQIMAWNMTTNTVEVLYDTFDYITPEQYLPDAMIMDTDSIFSTTCSNNYTFDIFDFTHGNSVQVSLYDGSYIVSLYKLGTVVSFHRDGRGLQWSLSATLPTFSTMSFADNGTKFFHQHDVEQMKNGNLRMLANVNFQANCTIWNPDVCWSRALELRMDFQRMIASVAWEFDADREIFSLIGGSLIRPIATGNYYAYFSKVEKSAGATGIHQPGRLFEVDPNGTVIALVQIPPPNETHWYSGGYRAIPLRLSVDD